MKIELTNLGINNGKPASRIERGGDTLNLKVMGHPLTQKLDSQFMSSDVHLPSAVEGKSFAITNDVFLELPQLCTEFVCLPRSAFLDHPHFTQARLYTIVPRNNNCEHSECNSNPMTLNPVCLRSPVDLVLTHRTHSRMIHKMFYIFRIGKFPSNNCSC
jgi:hypothetical protein